MGTLRLCVFVSIFLIPVLCMLTVIFSPHYPNLCCGLQILLHYMVYIFLVLSLENNLLSSIGSGLTDVWCRSNNKFCLSLDLLVVAGRGAGLLSGLIVVGS